MANGISTGRNFNNNSDENTHSELELPDAIVDSQPIDNRYGWVVVFASFCIHIITDGITYSFGVIYIALLSEFNEGKGYTSSIMSLMTGMTLCTGPISSVLVNKFGCRAVTIAGAMIASACLFISAYAQNVFELIISIGFGVGCGLGLIYLPAIVSVSMYFKKYRSLATGIAVAGSGLGTSIFAPLISALAETYGWRHSLLILSGIVLICAVFGALFRPITESVPQSITTEYSDAYQREDTRVMKPAMNSRCNHKLHSNGILNTLLDDNISNHKSHSVLSVNGYNSIRQFNANEDLDELQCECIPSDVHETIIELTSLDLLKNPLFVLFAVSNIATVLGFYIPYFYLPDRAKELDVSEKDVGSMLATIGIANTIGRITLGYISNGSYTKRLQVYKICLFICGLATVLSVFCYDLQSLIAYAAVFGFMIGAYVGLTSVLLADLLGLNTLTNAFGLLMLFQGIASFTGPPIVGMLYDVFNSYTPGFVFAGIMISTSSILVAFIPKLQNYVAYKQLRCEISITV